MIDPLVIPIVAIVGSFATGSIGIVAHYVYLIQRLKAENALKQDMLMRGYSAEEIARVIGAQCGTETSCGEHRHKAPDAKKAAPFAA
jgi:hypothetical protein